MPFDYSIWTEDKFKFCSFDDLVGGMNDDQIRS